MKVGILTITDGANYGNRLQNYALQRILTSIDVDVETVKRYTNRDRNIFQKCEDLVIDFIKVLIGKKNTSFCFRQRRKDFERFNKNYINFSKEFTKNNNVSKGLDESFDYFICGSDQIWNTKFDIIKSDINNYLAAFTDGNKRIAFAASFGSNGIDLDYEEYFREELSKFKAIAVREENGKKIVDSITKKNSIVVMDPTLILEKSEWVQFEKRPQFYAGDKYIVTYFLGGRNGNMEAYIRKLSEKMGCRVVNLEIEFLSDDKIENTKIFRTTPEEFVWLIHNAEAVLTDSFHATVFSIIFDKPFVVFERIAVELDNDMSSRIDNLLGKFGLMEKKDNIEKPVKIPEIPRIKEKEQIIAAEREKALLFLKNAMELTM